MRVWTIQPLVLYNRLKEERILHCDLNLSDYKEEGQFVSAYDWMSDQMKKRIGQLPEGVRYPFWAWHTLNWENKKPDLRKTEFRSYSEASVCLELEIPENQVLLSDEENWHFVLNNWFFSDSDNEEDYNKDEGWFDALPQDVQQYEKKKSWEKIFNVAPSETKWHRCGCFIQATFWELRLEQIVAVRYFCWKKHTEI